MSWLLGNRSSDNESQGTPHERPPEKLSAMEEMTKQRAENFLKREVTKLREEVNKLKEDNTLLRQLLFSQQQQQEVERQKAKQAIGKHEREKEKESKKDKQRTWRYGNFTLPLSIL
jgi:hypothetical protein